MPFCSNCGKEVKENAKFCQNCGNAINAESKVETPQQNNNSGINCPTCGSIIPFGNVVCSNCGTPLNQEKHTAAIVIGYLTAVFIPIVGIIMGIYLLTRKNKDVRIHGILMIVVAIILSIIWMLFFSYISYVNSMSYYDNYYYY